MTRPTATREWLPRVVATVCVAATLALAGCAPEDDNASIEETKLLDYTQVQAEYREATSALEVPVGYEYPVAFEAAEGELYEAGYGRARAVALWNCAWGQEWLRVRTEDPAAAPAALKAYKSVEETDVFRTLWDPISIQEPFRDAVERAELGDPSLVQADVQANCR